MSETDCYVCGQPLTSGAIGPFGHARHAGCWDDELYGGSGGEASHPSQGMDKVDSILYTFGATVAQYADPNKYNNQQRGTFNANARKQAKAQLIDLLAQAKDMGGEVSPRPSKHRKDCVFCERIAKGEYDDKYANHVWFEPLNPVVEGHRLVVPVVHTPNLNDPELEANQTGWALRYFTNDLKGDYNIITSKGTNATQTIQHLHFHIVPREKGDGLQLPWTNQEVAEDVPPPTPVKQESEGK